MKEELEEVEEKEEGDTFTAKEKKAFENLRHDYKRAKSAKTTIDKLIVEWNDLYYGKVSKTSDDNKSKMVMKEIAKQIEWQKPNIMEPFTATSNPIRTRSIKDSHIGKVLEKYTNYQFTEEFDRETFMDQLTDVLLREGTVWIKVGWELEEEEVVERNAEMSMDEVMARSENGEQPQSISANKDGTFKVVYRSVKNIKNKPTAEVCRNEHIFPDPSARTDKDCRFIIHRDYKTLSEMKATGWYSEEVLEKLGEHDASTREDTGLGSARDSDALDYGLDVTYQPKDKATRKIAIMQYWGFYDLNGDGIAEPILAEWAERESIDLRIEKNPMPSKNIPFFRDVYSARPFSLWGNALAFFIGDNQKAKTGIVRGIFDNMSMANNGQKFVERGALDYINFKRMRNGERHIIVNKKDAIHDGSYNELPSAIFNTLQMLNSETEQLSGVSSGGPALSIDGASQDKDNQMTMSQKKMSSIVRGVSSLMSKVFYEWILMAKVFLDNEQIEEMFVGSEMEAYNAFKNAQHCSVKMSVGTEVNRNIRINQLNLLLQQSQALGEMAPKDSYSTLVAEMYELFDMYDEAQKLRDYKPEPTKMEVEQHQMAMLTQQLQVQKLQVEIENLRTEGRLNVAKAQLAQADGISTMQYKEAQTAEKYAKVDSHKMDNALKPAEAIRKQVETESKLNEKEKPI